MSLNAFISKLNLIQSNFKIKNFDEETSWAIKDTSKWGKTLNSFNVALTKANLVEFKELDFTVEDNVNVPIYNITLVNELSINDISIKYDQEYTLKVDNELEVNQNINKIEAQLKSGELITEIHFTDEQLDSYYESNELTHLSVYNHEKEYILSVYASLYTGMFDSRVFQLKNYLGLNQSLCIIEYE